MGYYVQSSVRGLGGGRCQPTVLDLAKLSLKNEGETNIFPDKQKMKKFISTRLPLHKNAERNSSS